MDTGLEVTEDLTAPKPFAPRSSLTSSSLVALLRVYGHILLKPTRGIYPAESVRKRWAPFHLVVQIGQSSEEEDLDTTAILSTNTRHEVLGVEHAHQYLSGDTIISLQRCAYPSAST